MKQLFQKEKNKPPVTESNPSSKPKVTEVRTGKETDITTSYQQHLKRLIADNNSDIQSSQKKIEELHTLIDTKNKDNKKLQSIYDAISELHWAVQRDCFFWEVIDVYNIF